MIPDDTFLDTFLVAIPGDLVVEWTYTEVESVVTLAAGNGWSATHLAAVVSSAVYKRRPDHPSAYAWRVLMSKATDIPPTVDVEVVWTPSPCTDSACDGYGWHNYAGGTGPAGHTHPNAYATKCPTGRLAPKPETEWTPSSVLEQTHKGN